MDWLALGRSLTALAGPRHNQRAPGEPPPENIRDHIEKIEREVAERDRLRRERMASMSVDPVHELSVRAIAHNLARKFPPPAFGPTHEIRDYARRLAELFDGDTDSLAQAGLALWRAMGGASS